MKNISIYKADKYQTPGFTKIEENIYKINDASNANEDEFVTSLSFEQEAEYDEGTSPQDISQYPLEDILEKYLVYVKDFYENENAKSDSLCYLEFCSPDVNDLKRLLEIVGKHVYNKQFEKDGKKYVTLMVE